MSNPEISTKPGSPGNANLIYILHLAATITGITGLIAVIMAYVSRDGAEEWLVSHYNHQINLFWKFLLFILIGTVLAAAIIGFLIIPCAYIWFIVRNVKGIQILSAGEPYPYPGGWGL